MAIGWLTVLQNVPWSEVIANAPKVADGAKKLWNAVAKKDEPVEPVPSSEEAPLSPEGAAIAELQTRIASLESALSDLHGQMLASTELINALAEQNAQLVHRIETNRVRTLWLSGALAVVAVIAIAAVAAAVMGAG